MDLTRILPTPLPQRLGLGPTLAATFLSLTLEARAPVYGEVDSSTYSTFRRNDDEPDPNPAQAAPAAANVPCIDHGRHDAHIGAGAAGTTRPGRGADGQAAARRER